MSDFARRDLLLSLPAFSLMSLAAAAQTGTRTATPAIVGGGGKSQNGLHTDFSGCKAFPFEAMPVRYSDGGALTHDILQGTIPTGELVELHETTLAPGKMPHPAHQHPHSEFILVREGAVEFTYRGETHALTPGSVGFTAPNEMHGFRNAGTVPATYFIFSLSKH